MRWFKNGRTNGYFKVVSIPVRVRGGSLQAYTENSQKKFQYPCGCEVVHGGDQLAWGLFNEVSIPVWVRGGSKIYRYMHFEELFQYP